MNFQLPIPAAILSAAFSPKLGLLLILVLDLLLDLFLLFDIFLFYLFFIISIFPGIHCWRTLGILTLPSACW